MGEEARKSNDVRLFNEIAEDYAAKDNIPANRIARKFRLDQTLKQIPISHYRSILEVGCGAGFSARYIENHYRQYVGIDHSSELISYAKNNHQHNSAKFYCIDLKQFEAQNQFDVIFLIGVLHHLTELPKKLDHMINLLKPGGWLIANEPMKGNKIIGNLRKIRKKVDSHYSRDQIEFSKIDLLKLFNSAGLKKVNIIPQGVLSTPFAEIKMPFQSVTSAISRISCFLDEKIENKLGWLLPHIAWNLIAIGKKSEC